eukprot:CAMPEP_0185725746 /NCGR_PEP_ID=MMETSP1171-20130828/1925_1 /TAXON_ID=374046 /ORGANISM="Helicotheca tamensis, Strain CCMP826" /LENGTH=83 /DNA_ID=CAMNT_0028393941 /DNA_START=458 /DNA_END=709 /DNA_ORIENTATION=+
MTFLGNPLKEKESFSYATASTALFVGLGFSPILSSEELSALSSDVTDTAAVGAEATTLHGSVTETGAVTTTGGTIDTAASCGI